MTAELPNGLHQIFNHQGIDMSNDIARTEISSVSLLMDMDSMARIERVAELMAGGKTTVPQHLRGNVGDCFAIVMQSMTWGMNPFSVAQKTHFVNGTLGYEAQLISAVINNSRIISDRFKFEWFGPWEKVIGKFTVKRGEKGEYRVPGWTFADEEGCGIRVSATLKGESQPRVLELLLSQARVRNSTQWADDPKQQLAYLGQKKWGRLYASDVILGVYSPEEITEPQERFMGMADEVPPPPQSQPDTKAARPALEAYPADRFAANLPKWRELVQSGQKTPEAIRLMVASRATLSAEQLQAIADLGVQDVQPKPAPAQPEYTPPPADDENADFLAALGDD